MIPTDGLPSMCPIPVVPRLLYVAVVVLPPPLTTSPHNKTVNRPHQKSVTPSGAPSGSHELRVGTWFRRPTTKDYPLRPQPGDNTLLLPLPLPLPPLPPPPPPPPHHQTETTGEQAAARAASAPSQVMMEDVRRKSG